MTKDYDQILDVFANMRALKDVLNESEDESTDAIPYTANDDLLAKMTNEARESFGADFSKTKSPLLYHPKDGDVTLIGEIPGLENMSFKFQLNSGSDGSGIVVGIEELPLSDDVIKTLSTVNGVGKNWKKELNQMRQDLKPVSVRENDSSAEQLGERRYRNGDDVELYEF